MSSLLIDIGNSRLKWVAASLRHSSRQLGEGSERASADDQGSVLSAAVAINHDGNMATAIDAIARQWQRPAPSAVFIAHVTGASFELAISQAVDAAFGTPPQFARSAAECLGLRSAYAEPLRLGVDRWLAMLAIWARTRQPFCVASAGTALTFDAVDANGQHQGGVIAPGLAGLIDATLGRTRFAVAAIVPEFTDGLGLDTEACVRLGALHAAAGLLDRLGARYSGAQLLAGGDASMLAPLLATSWQIEPDLVLQGLAVWAELSSKT